MTEGVPCQFRGLNAQPVEVEGRTLVVLQDPLGLCSGQPLLLPEAYHLLTLLDGTRTVEQIRAACQALVGQPVGLEEIESIIGQFDEHLFLASPRFEEALERARAEFKRLDFRSASQAGLSYPGQASELNQVLDAILALRPSAPLPDLIGLIAPHIDFARGARVYASAFQSLTSDKDRLCLLLGTAHSPTQERYVVCDKDFMTPLGRAQTDQELAGRLISLQQGRFSKDVLVHLKEHSLEFQVVFLQHLIDPAVRILPVLCGGLDQASQGGTSPGLDEGEEEFLSLLAEIVAQECPLVVVGADLAHVGPLFGDPKPVTRADLEQLQEQDLTLLQRAAQLDAEGFFRNVAAERDRRNICGLAPIYAALRILSGSRGRLLDYGQWLDEKGQGSVTFAALAFCRT